MGFTIQLHNIKSWPKGIFKKKVIFSIPYCSSLPSFLLLFLSLSYFTSGLPPLASSPFLLLPAMDQAQGLMHASQGFYLGTTPSVSTPPWKVGFISVFDGTWPLTWKIQIVALNIEDICLGSNWPVTIIAYKSQKIFNISQRVVNILLILKCDFIKCTSVKPVSFGIISPVNVSPSLNECPYLSSVKEATPAGIGNFYISQNTDFICLCEGVCVCWSYGYTCMCVYMYIDIRGQLQMFVPPQEPSMFFLFR